jgi:hypothetical protein
MNSSTLFLGHAGERSPGVPAQIARFIGLAVYGFPEKQLSGFPKWLYRSYRITENFNKHEVVDISRITGNSAASIRPKRP